MATRWDEQNCHSECKFCNRFSADHLIAYQANLIRKIGQGRFDLLQVPFNLFDRKFLPYMEELHRRGVEIHVRSTFLQGLFFMDRDALPEKLRPLRKYLLALDDYARQTGLDIAQLALNYNLQQPCIDGVLIGVDNVAQLKANLSAVADVPVSLDLDIREQELLNPVNWK